MPTVFKRKDFKFKEDPSSIENFRIETADPRLSRIVNSENMIFDIRLLNPGQFSFPYHFHRHAEELMFIISGSLTMRSPSGFQVLQEGDVIFFEMGERGAHQLFNHTESPCTYLDIKTALANDICEYPDSGKLSVSPNREIFEKSTQADYFKGEENVKEIWKKLKKE
jgi:uncharacterized cupin superfamily protein